MTDHDMQAGIAAFVDYFASGNTAREQQRLGFELEQLITYQDGTALPYALGNAGADNADDGDANEHLGVLSILERLRPLYNEATINEELGGALLGLARPGATITLEPGAQFEFAPAPFTCLDELQTMWTAFASEMGSIVEELGLKRHQLGYQPRSKVSDIALIPKRRYQFMNRYFASLGERGARGINMMRGTASTQVIVDYVDEADAVIKMQVAAAFGPLFALLTDNCPFFEGELTDGYLTRARIWNDVDPARCNVIPGLFDTGFGFADYARYVLGAPLVVAAWGAHGETTEYAGERTAADFYDLTALDTDTIDHLLSMFFFDVRLRRYVEIRFVDSLPLPYALAFVALIKGLFYNEDNLRDLHEWCAGLDDEFVPALKSVLMADGFDAHVPIWNRSAAEVCAELLARARRGLPADETVHLDVLDRVLRERRTLTDIRRAQYKKTGEI